MEIEISNIKKQYNRRIVLDIDELAINKAAIVGVLGNNGAGKTTLLRIILDLLKSDSGSVSIRGIDVSKDEKWKCYTSAYLDESFLIDFLTPEEYFVFIAESYEKDLLTYNEQIDDFHPFMNNEILNQKKYIRDFSSGNRQKIGIIGSFISKPEILVLDEPFNYLDPTSQFFIKDHLSDLNKSEGVTMVISSHNLECIYDIATQLIVLENGKIVKKYDTVDINVKEELKDYFKINK
jgi:ABC-type multidrug transport system, ATPase component